SAMAIASTSTRSPIDTIAPTALHTGRAAGAAARKSARLPHSSASTCEKAMYRRSETGITFSTCARTSSNIFLGPVWNSSGCSSTTTYRLSEKPRGPSAGGSAVLIREVSGAIWSIEAWGIGLMVSCSPDGGGGSGGPRSGDSQQHLEEKPAHGGP